MRYEATVHIAAINEWQVGLRQASVGGFPVGVLSGTRYARSVAVDTAPVRR